MNVSAASRRSITSLRLTRDGFSFAQRHSWDAVFNERSKLRGIDPQRLKDDVGSTLLALGNVVRVWNEETKTPGVDSTAILSKNTEAVEFYQQAIAKTSNPLIQLEAHLNSFSLLIDTQQTTQASSLLPQIQSLLAKLPPSRSTVYAQVNLD